MAIATRQQLEAFRLSAHSLLWQSGSTLTIAQGQ